MTDRYQSVVIDGFVLRKFKILHGVSQGSVLGLLLFNLFIDDIVNIASSDKSVLFADDIVVCVKDKNFNTVVHRVKLLVNDINNWLKRNNHLLNNSKIVLMLFTKKKLPTIYQIFFLWRFFIKMGRWCKIMELIIDNKLNFKLQI